MLPMLVNRMTPVLEALTIDTELIFVDDGSHDETAQCIVSMIETRVGLKLVKLSRNFGKEAALTAGIEHATGDAVIVIDADLQDPPELISEMVQAWQLGADVVLMQRRSRHGESILKRLSAHLFYRLLNQTSRTNIPVDTGDFRLMSRRAVDALTSLNERNRYMKGLFAWVGMPTVVLQYDRDLRAAGETKQSYSKLIGLAFEGLTSFSISPLRWATGLGLVTATLGAIFGLWIVIKALLVGDTTAGYPSLVAVTTFFSGVQLLSIGIVGEYVGKTYVETKQRPIYIKEDVLESKKNK
jgi:glycosyltransferase involved in cell wall biosynthesis